MEQMKRARENEARFRELKGKFFGLEFTDGTIVVRVLDSVEAYYDEGNALHHCVGQCEYYLKPNTLVFSARIENKRVGARRVEPRNIQGAAVEGCVTKIRNTINGL